MSRSLPEWVGKTPDSPIPARVKLRVFEAHGGVCHISKRKIRAGEAWQCDHVRALINGGENRERNLAPALADAHRAKTAEDVAIKSKTYRMAAKHNGTWTKSKRQIPSRGFGVMTRKMDGSVAPTKVALRSQRNDSHDPQRADTGSSGGVGG